MKKVQKLFLPLLLVCIALFVIAGCTPKTEYDEKQVVKIETQFYNGEGIVGYRMRLFDFESGTVTDKAVISDRELDYLLRLYVDYPSGYPEYESAEEYKDFLLSHYNVPVTVAEFSQEDGNAFINAAKSLGIYTWQQSYDNDYIFDAADEYITITFADGTTKTTHFYCKYPKNFEKVETAFEDNFGAEAWCGLRLT